MSALLDLQRGHRLLRCPPKQRLQAWVGAALARCGRQGEVSLRVVDETEMRAMNLRFRHRDGVTNVLSFPHQAMHGIAQDFLGDVVVCAPVVEREALEQDKTEAAHWAHLVVHGTLHLLGYDHVLDDEAAVMEAMEVAILESLGFADPYLWRMSA